MCTLLTQPLCLLALEKLLYSWPELCLVVVFALAGHEDDVGERLDRPEHQRPPRGVLGQDRVRRIDIPGNIIGKNVDWGPTNDRGRVKWGRQETGGGGGRGTAAILGAAAEAEPLMHECMGTLTSNRVAHTWPGAAARAWWVPQEWWPVAGP